MVTTPSRPSSSRAHTARADGYQNPGPGDAQLSFTLTKPQLLGVLAGGGLEGVAHNGDLGALQRLLSVLDTPLPPSRS